MKKLNKTPLKALLLLFTLVVISSCGDEPVSKKANTNKLNIRIETSASFLNPLLPGTGQGRYVAADIFQTLGDLNPKNFEIMPVMVKEIPKGVKVEDGPYKGTLAYQFELLEAAKWDNGTPVTANDVVFTLKLIFNPLLSTEIWRNYFDKLQGVEIDPTNPRKFTFYNREFYFLAVESFCQFPIYPAYHYDPGNLMQNIAINDLLDPAKAEAMSKQNPNLQKFAEQFSLPEYGTEKSKIVGSGAYRVDFFDKEQGAVLVKKENWWGNPLVSTYPALFSGPDTLNYMLVKAEDAALNMIQAGSVDIVSNIQPLKFLELQKDPAYTKDYNFVTQWASTYNRVLLNMRDPILSDKKVRQALSFAVDYDDMLNNIQHGLASRTVGPINPSKPYYAKDLALYTYNIEKAKALLSEAGWTDTDKDGVADKVIRGKKTDLVLSLMVTAGHPTSDLVAASLQNSMGKVGIKVEIKPTELPTINKETKAGNFQLATTASAMFPGWAELDQNYHSQNVPPKGDNRPGLVNKELDGLTEQIRTSQNETERTAMYIRAQEIIHDEVPEIFLYAPVYRFVLNKRFDYVLSPLSPPYSAHASKLKK